MYCPSAQKWDSYPGHLCNQINLLYFNVHDNIPGTNGDVIEIDKTNKVLTFKFAQTIMSTNHMFTHF